jgi:hypothetical protein
VTADGFLGPERVVIRVVVCLVLAQLLSWGEVVSGARGTMFSWLMLKVVVA